MKYPTAILVRFDQDLYDQLREVSKDRSMAAVVRAAVREYLTKGER